MAPFLSLTGFANLPVLLIVFGMWRPLYYPALVCAIALMVLMIAYGLGDTFGFPRVRLTFPPIQARSASEDQW